MGAMHSTELDKFDYLVVIDEQFKKLAEMGGKEGVIEGAKLILPPDEVCRRNYR